MLKKHRLHAIILIIKLSLTSLSSASHKS